ncbi:hypothetical protein [Okeania sp. SIO2B3]|nr:hypothetical protein [Okeania sp. SIO2B3]
MKLLSKIFQIISQQLQGCLGDIFAKECTKNFSLIMEILGWC